MYTGDELQGGAASSRFSNSCFDPPHVRSLPLDLPVYQVTRFTETDPIKVHKTSHLKVSHHPHPLTPRVGGHPFSSTCRKVARSLTSSKAAGFWISSAVMAHGFGVSHLLVVLAAAFVIAVPVLAIKDTEAKQWYRKVESKPQSLGGVTTRSTGTSRTIVVDQSGRGNFKNVQSAINAVPNGNQRRVIIVIGPGVYRFKLVTMTLRCLHDSQKSHSWHLFDHSIVQYYIQSTGGFY